MYIEKELSQYIIYQEESILNALQKIEVHKGRIIFVLDENHRLQGLLTNGDILRWLMNQTNVNLEQPVKQVINRKFLYATVGDEPEKIKLLLDKVLYIPLIDKNKRLVAVARHRHDGEGMRIDNFHIHEKSSTFIIAEIGINHNGNFGLAKQLVDSAIASGANCAKFQMRNIASLYQNAGNANDAKENLGSQYTLDLLSRFQLTDQQMLEIFDYCQEKGILPLCTPWDLKSLEILEKYGMKAYKVASADLTNHQLLSEIAKTGKPLICSTGMSTEQEIKESVKLLQDLGTQYILLHCNSTYPAPFKDINLNYLDHLKQIGQCLVGYSGHERGFFVPIAAVAKGAKVIEKHITLDRNMEGNDHKVSLLPSEFKTMIEAIQQIEEALGNSSERRISQGEMMNRVTLAKSLVINCSLKQGEIIKPEMIEIKSPGRGLQPNRRQDLIGQIAKRNFQAGDYFYPSDLVEQAIKPRQYKFKRPWGLPVRYHDYQKILDKSNPDFLEFHLSYKDLEEPIDKYFKQKLNLQLIVHSPELFFGDHTLDLCSLDENYRQRSIFELQRVIDITNELKLFFSHSSKPLIVTNVGGFTLDSHLPSFELDKLQDKLLDSLSKVDTNGVEIIPQTMPPFPWHFGGQRHHNIFVDAQQISEFCQKFHYRICLDISHSKLACNTKKWSFKEFIKQVAPYTAHIHIADAQDEDGEGLQIGQGDIDFSALASDLEEFAPHASFIPEIWQGHENEGEGFWTALEKLEGLL
ncbi:N-acetylneuraminate synthase family protein [Cyanobacterium sp. DS4]|uniref:N-acetylneuraminate synthase family protein n=1 Tax=Cyanobacterium sp. DS4 TaxID=2878255 RepID=UPI002E824999|nr:N-acetylneuraminate synthase family protein [Cyanobacterium sp. Dongsha4]WVL02254.1 N-acetylneuraminate synthase family protein [Cyanobacterium sp. Dongsha4]